MTDVVPETGRKLGWGLAALVVAGNMIGSGLYLLPVTLAPFGSSSLIGWLVAGVGAAVLALVFGALGRLKPGADGLAGFAETGLGRFFGFQVAIAFWTACLVGNVAVAVAATGYLAFFWPVLKDPVAATLCNLAIIWVATLAYVAGTRTASWLAAGALVVGLIPIVIAVAAGVVAFDPQLFAASWNPSGDSLKETVPASLVLIFWAYLGVESAAALSSRIRHPGKNLGRASLAGVALATLVYVGATVAVFGVIPLDALAASTSPYADLAARVFGASLAGFVAVCAVAKTIGTVGGWVMMGGETARAAARGRLPAQGLRAGRQDTAGQSADRGRDHDDRRRPLGPADPWRAVRHAGRRDLGADADDLWSVLGRADPPVSRNGGPRAGRVRPHVRRRGGDRGGSGLHRADPRGGGDYHPGVVHLAARRQARG
jgi:arginine:agmatine antiporter